MCFLNQSKAFDLGVGPNLPDVFLQSEQYDSLLLGVGSDLNQPLQGRESEALYYFRSLFHDFLVIVDYNNLLHLKFINNK